MYFYDAFSFTWHKGIRKRFNLPVCTHCYYMALLLLLAECLPIQIQTMNRMVNFIQSNLKCNNSLDRLSCDGNPALRGIGSYMSKSFNYTLSQFKLDATTFYNMKPSYFYCIIQNQYRKELDEKLLNTVSLAKYVLNNIKNACSTFF